MRIYAVHGLTIVVDGALPLDLPAGAAEPSLRVHAQQAPPWAGVPLDPARTFFRAPDDDDSFALHEAAWTLGGEGIRLHYSEGITFWIGAALDTVWLRYDSPLTVADAAYFLLEPVLAFVLRRRGRLALHASAVEFDGRAVVFCGPAGAGKSTTAAACVAAGAKLLADDLVVLAEEPDGWLAFRGVCSIRLWDDGARVLLDRLDRAEVFSPTWEKRVLSPELVGGQSGSSVAPVALVCVLVGRSGDSAAPRLAPASGQDALASLIANTAANYLHDITHRADELGQVSRLLRLVPAVTLEAHTDPARLADLAAAVRARIRG